jgi:iron complex outermembrane recepter protein
MKTLKSFISFIVLFAVFAESYSQEMLFGRDTTKVPDILLEETIIRAPKERTTIREIPGSVSVITSRAISETGVQTIKDITSVTPNFFMPDYGSKLTSPVYIRGVGSRINEPSVGLYVDNVPYYDKATFDFDLFDVDRIEILRGPQGTLYGRNTMGGIIHIITKSPMDYSGTRIHLSTASMGQYQGGLSHFAKPRAVFAYSASVNYRYTDGFYTNTFDNEKVDKTNLLGFRNRLIWQLNDKLSVENILSLEVSRQGGYPYALITDNESNTGDINYDHKSTYDRDLITNGLLVNYQSGDFELISTTSYQYLKDLQDVDQDFTSMPMFLATQDQLQHLVAQEVVLKSKTGKRLDWLFGGYGFNQNFVRNVNVQNQPVNMIIQRDFTEKKYGGAIFHQSTLNDFLVKNLSLIMGLRFDLERNSLAFKNDISMNGNPLVASDTLFPAMNFHVISPKIALNYLLGNQTSLFVLLSKGYKTGGFNPIFERDEDLMFEPEQSWNYEIGAKTSLLKNRLYLETSLFYIDLTNQQIYQTVPSGMGSMLKNAGHSVSKGLELSARTRITRNFESVVAYGYTDAKFISHVVNETTEYSGNSIPYIPKHTLALQLNQTIHFRENLLTDRMKISVFYKAVGEHYWNESNSALQNAYGLLDMRVRFERKSLALEFWGKNLLNNEYSAFYFEIQQIGNKYYQPGRPLHFGMNLSLAF